VGARRIIGRVAQLIVNIVDHRMGIQEAINAPSIDASTNQLLVGTGVRSGVVRQLCGIGYDVLQIGDDLTSVNYSSPTGILAGAGGKLHGGVDPLKPDNVALAG
jgi:gamma-glutamyltranspeptidase/glutathione hydrolase